jgi:hypothetical protein
VRPVALAVLAAALEPACGGSPARPAPAPAPAATRVPIADGEAEDGVEIVSSRGRMDPAVIETGIEPHKQDLGACYLSRVGARGWLGGRVSIQWEIQRDGEIAAVRLAESDLGAWPIERCLLEIARGATFGKPAGGDADFSIPLEFGAPSGSRRPELWDEDQALRAVGGQLAALDACDKAKGVKGPAPEDVTVTVYVGPQGKAQSVGFASPRSVLEDPWAECAEKAALAWRLPDPKRAIAKLAIRYRPSAP